MKKKIISSLIIIILALVLSVPIVYGKAHASSHISHHSSHSTSHSSSSHSASRTTIKGYKSGTGKTYTAPKSFTSKHNSSNIKTKVVNNNPSSYTNYSTSNIFKPNFWTAMWAFKCMNNNTKEVTEQDISKELEERGYTQEEIKEILKEGEQAKDAEKQDKKHATIVIIIIMVIVIAFIISIVFLIYNTSMVI